jgi:hypothetical protein
VRANFSAQAEGPLCAINFSAQAEGPLCAINFSAQAEGPLCAISKKQGLVYRMFYRLVHRNVALILLSPISLVRRSLSG